MRCIKFNFICSGVLVVHSPMFQPLYQEYQTQLTLQYPSPAISNLNLVDGLNGLG